MKKIEFYKHNITDKDIYEVTKVLKSIFLTTGKQTKKFEENFAKYLGLKYALGLSSCTDALFLSLKYFGIKEGDEVITTPLSFISTANAIEFCGAKPVFVDVEATTGNINADLIEKAITKNTKAIIVVHLYGQMCDMKKIKKIADKHKLKLIEDAAHCIEGERDGVRVGHLSDVSCFSFYATKNITSGEGGAIATNNKEIYEWIKKARLHGMSSNASDRYSKTYKHYDMEFLGYKSNMTDIQASLLLSQLKNIEKFLGEKEKIASKYIKGLKNIVSFPAVLKNTKHSRHVFTIWVNDKKRDSIMVRLQKHKIGIAVHFRPIHLMSYYKKKYGYKKSDFKVAEKIGNSTITIPLYPKLKQNEIDYIIRAVKSATKG
jgi:UDP-4-amino-4-deoxy-L-arabinose-oxoglutarate aminotransferase